MQDELTQNNIKHFKDFHDRFGLVLASDSAQNSLSSPQGSSQTAKKNQKVLKIGN